MIAADYSGSNCARSRVWKRDPQEKGAGTSIPIVTVCRCPTGPSRWNPIKPRWYSEISKTWAACPLRSFDDVLHCIRDTKTETCLTWQAHLVTATCETGVKVRDHRMDALSLQSHGVCPQWNYAI